MGSNLYSRISSNKLIKLNKGGNTPMNNLNIKFDNVEQLQRELNKQLNKLEAESKILHYILLNLNKKGSKTI